MSLPPVFTSWSPRGLFLRLAHEVRARLNLYSADPPELPAGTRDPGPLEGALPPELLGEGWMGERVVEMADGVLQGEAPFFGEAWRPLPVTPEEWNGDGAFPRDRPWWRIPLRPLVDADVKDSWEPGRFHWGIYLAAAWRRTGEARYRDALLERVEGWLAANPPYRGVQWACGQETSLRLMALLQCEALLTPVEPAGGEGRVPSKGGAAVFHRLAWLSGHRVEEAFGYAVSQRNNHHISEAVGLICAGLRWGSDTPEGRRWVERGRRELSRAVAAQFTDDGWYVQNSPGYQRFATEVAAFGLLLLAEREGASGRASGGPSSRGPGGPSSSAPIPGLAASVQLLSRLSGDGEAMLPTMGASDGSFFIPPLEIPARGEEVRRGLLRSWAWLRESDPALPPAPEAAAATGPDLSAAVRSLPSGLLLASVGPWRVSARVRRVVGRPGHADLLHLNVRHLDREVIVDPGSFRYNGRGLWRNALAQEDVHNAPVSLEHALTRKGPGFLWLRFPRGRVADTQESRDGVRVILLRSDGLRRELRVEEGEVVIRDTLPEAVPGPWRVRWTLAPQLDPSWISSEPPGTVHEGSEEAVRGWFAPGYGVRIRTRVLEIQAANGRRDIVTTIRVPTG